MENLNLQMHVQGAHNNRDTTTWALPEHAIARLGRGYVQAVAHAPNKGILAVGSRIGVWLYDTSTMIPFALWETERGLIAAVAFSPNGDLLATSNWDGDIKIWDVQSLRCISKMERVGKFNGVCQLAFSSDQQYLAACSGGSGDSVYIWHAMTAEQVLKFPIEKKTRSGLGRIQITFSPDSSLLAGVTRDDIISIWDIEAGERIACLNRQSDIVYDLIFSPCGQHLISLEGNVQPRTSNLFRSPAEGNFVLRKWEINQHIAENRNLLLTSFPVEKGARRLTYSSDETLLAATFSQTHTAIWDVESNKKLTTLAHQESPKDLCFSTRYAFHDTGEHTAKQRLKLIVGGRKTLQIWSFEEPTSQATVIHEHTYSCESLKFSPDGKKLVNMRTIPRIWDVASKRSENLPVDFPFNAIHFTDCGTVEIVATSENGIKAYEIANHGEWKPKPILSKNLLWVARDGVVYEGIQKLFTLETCEMTIRTHAFSPDGSLLVVGLENRQEANFAAEVWNVKHGKHIATLPLTRQLPADMYRGDTQTIENTLAKKFDRGLLGDKGPMGLTFSPCGNLIAGGLPAAIRLWDAITYETVMVICPPIEYLRPYALAFSPCGQSLASGGWWFGLSAKVPIQLWEVATGANIATFWGHPTDIQCLAFSPDGTVLASGSFDGTILLWDVTRYLQNEKS